MFNQEEIRTYEISIWTLQDSFITILKWANFERKGEIENAILTLDVDGTQSLNFSIPMYLKQTSENGYETLVENPIWYNTKNGNLIMNMRKIKVILNKTLSNEKVYDFLIVSVKERHENNLLYCDVECEGLAFHELGRIGYNFILNQDEYYLDYEKWFKESTNLNERPAQTIQYWNNKILLTPLPSNLDDIIPTKWYYDVRMNWNSYINSDLKSSNKVYEEEYISYQGNTDYATGTETIINNSQTTISVREKERPVKAQESNIYNITQTIAKTFGVFCKYEYLYDSNYHIIGRVVVYYNNFIEEDKGILDLTYSYQTSKIDRTLDGTEIVTKMYVKMPNDNEELNIMNADANKSRENYLLNFDYLHNYNIISDDLYSSISSYEDLMRMYNFYLERYTLSMNIIQDSINKANSSLSIAKKSRESALEQIDTANKYLIVETGNEDKKVEVKGFNAKIVIPTLEQGSNCYYINIPYVGVIPESIKLTNGQLSYKEEDSSNPVQGTDITEFGVLDYDEYNDLKGIWGIPKDKINNNLSIFLECTYIPYTHWTKVKNYWEKIQKKAEKDIARLNTQIQTKTTSLENYENQYKQNLNEKNEYKSKFEERMGPALREGYWQPTDYSDYSTKYLSQFSDMVEKTNNFVRDRYAACYWDMNIFEDEEDIIFEQGVDTKQYLIIDLSNLTSNQRNFIANNFDNLSFIYYEASAAESEIKLERIVTKGDCLYTFINKNRNNVNAITPVLIIKNSHLFSNKQLKFFQDSNNNYNLYRSKITNKTYTVNDNGEINETETDFIIIDKSWYMFGEASTSASQDLLITYPIMNSSIKRKRMPLRLRVDISALNLKTSSSDLYIRLDTQNSKSKILKEYEDYYITKDFKSIYITIKPEVIFKLGDYSPRLTISYILSNTDSAIYLDAVEILKENSMPKVSYTIDLNILNKNSPNDIYNKLCRIVRINDIGLKFENVRGYISHITMDLSHPWNDKIEIKNYKTKFEDLFTNIVVQTAELKKNKDEYDTAAGAFNADGSIKFDAISQTLNENISSLEFKIDIKDQLKQAFDEAGMLLSHANDSLLNLKTISSQNVEILSGFYNEVQNGLSKGIDYTVPYTLISGDTKTISAVRINKDEGIFIGSNKKIVLSSTNAIKDANGNYIADPQISQSGANVEITPDRILMGVNNFGANEAGVVDIRSYQMLFAVGSTAEFLEDNPNKTMTDEDKFKSNSPLSGVQILKNYIGLAASDNNKRSIISLNSEGIKFTTTTNLNVGSYIYLTQNGIDLATTNNNVKGSYISLKPEKIQLAVANDNSQLSNVNIEHNKIQLILNNNTYMLMTPENFRVQTSNNTYINMTATNFELKTSSTAYIKMTAAKLEIGSSSDIDINTNNLAIRTVTENNVLKRIFRLGTSESNYDLLYKTNDGLKIKGSFTVGDPTGNNSYLSYSTSGGLQIQGNITATGLTLANNVSIIQNGQPYDLSDLKDGTEIMSYDTTYCTVDSYSYLPPDDDDESWLSYPDLKKGKYLWSRTYTYYFNGDYTVSYLVTYIGADGKNGVDGDPGEDGKDGIYVKQIIPLYYLSSTETTPSINSETTIYSSSTVQNKWTRVMPQYVHGYIYYTCDKQVWSDDKSNNHHITFTTVVKNSNLTYPAKIGKLFETEGLRTNYTYGSVPYSIALLSSKNLLIGANSGITILQPEYLGTGSAILMNSLGITLTSATVTLDASDGASVISLSENGINLASTAEINMETGGKFNISADSGAISLGDYFTIDSEGNLRCKSITCETLNGTDVSNVITTPSGGSGQTPTTTYGSGNKIWLSGKATTILGRAGQSQSQNLVGYETEKCSIKLDYNIMQENTMRIKLSFAEKNYTEDIKIISCILYINNLETTFTFNNNDKLSQGKNWVISNKSSIGYIPSGTYNVRLKITIGYVSVDQYMTFYPSQSYLEII